MASFCRVKALRQTLAVSQSSFIHHAAAVRPTLRSQTALLQAQRAAFQTTPQRAILTPLPQRIDGTVNDAATIPECQPTHGSYHWSMERFVSAALIPITVAPFAAGSLHPGLDGLLIGLTLIHSHIGFESCIVDYLPKHRVPKTRKVAEIARLAGLFIVGWGWYEFETNDVGLTEGIKRIWKA